MPQFALVSLFLLDLAFQERFHLPNAVISGQKAGLNYMWTCDEAKKMVKFGKVHSHSRALGEKHS